MIRNTFSIATGLALLISLAGCDDGVDHEKNNKSCADFAEHLAQVLESDHKATPISQRDAMVKTLVEDCSANPPSEAVMACAMKATDGQSIKACDALAAE